MTNLPDNYPQAKSVDNKTWVPPTGAQLDWSETDKPDALTRLLADLGKSSSLPDPPWGTGVVEECSRIARLRIMALPALVRMVEVVQEHAKAIPCSCDEGFTKRGRVDPGCHLHYYDNDELIDCLNDIAREVLGENDE